MIPHVNDNKGILTDEELSYAQEQQKHIKWYHHVLLNRPLKVCIALILVAILTPILIYQLAFYSSRRVGSLDSFSTGSCLVARESRLPCGLGYVPYEECHERCCYDVANGMCFHRFPSQFSYIPDQNWAEEVLLRPRVSTVPFKSQNSSRTLRLSLDEISPTHLSITYYNPTESEFTGRRIEDKEYSVQLNSPELDLAVTSLGRTIFHTVRGPLIASDNIWEIAFKLTDDNMYGFGEIPIELDTVKIIYNHRGGMTSLPLIFAKTNSTYHGLLIDAVNPTEVNFREDNVVLIRSITQFGLKFHVFVGPKPVDIMNDVRKLVGYKKDLQYWMLGAHICNEYDEMPTSTAELNNFVQEATTHNLPFESHCFMPIVFDDSCETEAITLMNEGADLLQKSKKRFIPHVSPYIRYEVKEMIEDDNITSITRDTECNSTVDAFEEYFLKDFNTKLYIGSVDSHNVVYPNYENISSELLEKFWRYTQNIDGIVFENSWPLDETDRFENETKHYLPYFSEDFEEAFRNTPNWNSTNSEGVKHLYTHNEYSNDFAKAFSGIKPSDNVPTWISSQRMNSNVFLYRQNIQTLWSNLQKELIEAALGGISGQWYWSTPICGDTDSFYSLVHLDLCVKWYMAATFLPMIKIGSKGTPRDPLSFQGTHRSLMINALRTRMILSPYFYTVLQDGPLLRPMFYEFPETEILKDITSQFSVGSDLLIVPSLQPDQAVIFLWMPPGKWFEFWGGLKLDGEEGEAITMAITPADFFTAIRGGSIVPLQKEVKLTAEETRLHSDISLTIALNCEHIEEHEDEGNTHDNTCYAQGDLYIDENVTIRFTADSSQITVSNTGNVNSTCTGIKLIMPNIIRELSIYGLNDKFNNYDHMRRVNTAINLCDLDNGDITVKFDE